STYRVAGLLPHYQIDITLPNSGFFRQLFVRHGKRSDGFRGELPLCGHDGKFTTLGSDDLPLDKNMVAESDIGFPVGQRVGSDTALTDHDLQLGATALTQTGEAELAGVPQEHDPSGHADRHSGGIVGREP